jgi:predicted nucleotidyltransferase
MVIFENNSKPIEKKIDKITELLKQFDFVDSIILFGSRARGKSGRDIDDLYEFAEAINNFVDEQ